MIEAAGLSLRYGREGPVGIEGASFRLDRGEVLGVLGTERSGKSTLLRILAGLIVPTAGRASVAGFDVVEETYEVRARTGYLPQKPSLHRDMTIEEYVDYWARVDGFRTDRRRERVKEVLGFLRLTDQAHEGILGTTSYNQRRAFFALPLLSDPEVLLLDEPFAGLSPEEREGLLGNCRDLRGSGKTIVLSSSRLSDLQTICTHIVTLSGGMTTKPWTTEALLQEVGEARHVRLFVEAGPSPSRIAPVLARLPGVVGMKESENAMVVFINPAVFRIADLTSALAGAGAAPTSVREADITIGDIFRTLSRRDSG